jgi:hypothetical protein
MSALTAKERAVEFLLQPPAIDYVRSLKDSIAKNPQYLEDNRVDIQNILHGFLAGSGVHWAHEIFEREWPGILRDTLDRLDIKE